MPKARGVYALIASVIVVSSLVGIRTAQAAPGDPFDYPTGSGTGFVFATGDPGSTYNGNMSYWAPQTAAGNNTGPYTMLGTKLVGATLVDAVGYRITDSYIWGISSDNPPQLVRIGQGGVPTIMGIPRTAGGAQGLDAVVAARDNATVTGGTFGAGMDYDKMYLLVDNAGSTWMYVLDFSRLQNAQGQICVDSDGRPSQTVTPQCLPTLSVMTLTAPGNFKGLDGSGDLVYSNGFLWTTRKGGAGFYRINPVTGAVAEVNVGSQGNANKGPWSGSEMSAEGLRAAWAFADGSIAISGADEYATNKFKTYRCTIPASALATPPGTGSIICAATTQDYPVGQHANDATATAVASDLGITKTVSPKYYQWIQPDAQHSDPITWTLTARNVAGEVAYGWQISDTFPAGFVATGMTYPTDKMTCAWTPAGAAAAEATGILCTSNRLPDGILQVGQTAAVSFTGYIEKAKATNQCVTNQATIATTMQPDLVTSNNSSPATTCLVPIEASKALDVANSVIADPPLLDAGDQVSYKITVKNTGTQPITGVTVDETTNALLQTGLWSGREDGKVAPLSTNPSLYIVGCSATGNTPFLPTPYSVAAGQTIICRTDVVTLPADVLDNAYLWNTAAVRATIGTDQVTVYPTTKDPVASAELTLAKTADPAVVDHAGQTVTFSYRVENTGHIAVDNVVATEASFTGTGTPPVLNCNLGTLAVGAVRTCQATYQVTQADIDAGQFTNNATVTGSWALGEVTDDDSVVVDAARRSVIELSKSVDKATVDTAGSTVMYTITAHNGGNTTLNAVAITELAFSGTNGPVSLICPTGTALAPGEDFTCTGTYTISQADIDSGEITNTAQVTAMSPTGQVHDEDTAVTTATKTPDITLTKIPSVPTVNAVGNTITYTLTAENTGNTTIDGVTITEDSFSGKDTTAGNPTALNCTPVANGATLAPGGKLICYVTYTVVQADLDAASAQITNAASVTGTAVGDGDVSDQANAVVNVTRTSGITLSKVPNPTTVNAPGQTVTYTITAHNSGTTTLTNVAVTEGSRLAGTFSGTGTLSALTCLPNTTTLAPGADLVCTVTYTTTQADIDAGEITNTASVSANSPGGGTVSDARQAIVTTTRTPGITLNKTSDVTSVNAPGDEVVYTITAHNSGNTTLTNVAISEGTFSGTGTLSPLTCLPNTTTLAPGADIVCEVTYTANQADIDAGHITNTATVSATSPTGTVSEIAKAIVGANQVTDLTLEKTASVTTVNAPGQTVTYTLTAHNHGTTTLTNVAITEGSRLAGTFSGTGTLGALSCTPSGTTLDPGEDMVCTVTYTTTQADIDAGVITNTASVSATSPTGPVGSTAPAVVNVNRTSGVSLTKVPDPDRVNAPGQTVTYTITAHNTGTTTLTNVAVTEGTFSGTGDLGTLSCPATTTLAPDADLVCTITYTTDQADIDAGSITNTARVTATSPTGAVSDTNTAIVTAERTPDITLAKTPNPATINATGDVEYTITAHNAGNTTLTNVAVTEGNRTDGTFSGTGTMGAVTCTPNTTTLAPGADLVCKVTYHVTQADIDAGTITNTAKVTGDAPTGGQVVDTAPAVVQVLRLSTIRLTKTAEPAADPAAGTNVKYTLTALNTGNTTLTNVAIAEATFSGTGTLPPLTCPGPTTIAPGETTTCTVEYTVTQADVDAGVITNAAGVTAEAPNSSQVTDTANAVVTITQTSAIDLFKTADPVSVDHAGEPVTYTITAHNSGNTTLTGVRITEGTFSGTGTLAPLTCDQPQPVTLVPGGENTCRVTYNVTQADIDAGQIDNRATVRGTSPTGRVQNADPTTVEAQRSPAIELTKTVAPATVTAAGTDVTYSFAVENTGNTTITDLAIHEDAFSGSGTMSAIDCPATTITPGATVTCTATYTVTQADIDAGTVTNQATATGNAPTGDEAVSTDDAAIEVTQSSDITLTKTPDPATVDKAGTDVKYTITAHNAGNTTLTAVTITEGAFSGTGTLPALTCPAGPITLKPGEDVTCEVTYTTTQADINAGVITNSAHVTATTPGSATVTDDADATVDVTRSPAIELTKTPNPTTVSAEGATVEYTLTARNAGNTTLTGVAISEGAFSGTGTLSALTCPTPAVTTLDPGETLVCTATYSFTQADIDAGVVTNAASVLGTAPGGAPVGDNKTAVVTVERDSELKVTKTADPVTATKAGDEVKFSVTVRNDGNTTITDLAVDELSFSGTGTAPVLTCPSPPVTTLGHGQAITCEATYTITQADVDAGQVVNTAKAEGKTTEGDVYDTGTAVVGITRSPGISLTKTPNPDTVEAANSPVTYTFTAHNSGNTTLTGVEITEGAFSGTGTLSALVCDSDGATLAPGDDITCRATYTVTQADMDAGQITNAAAVKATAPTGGEVTDDDQAAIDVTQKGDITLTKTATPDMVDAAGTQVTYKLVAHNNGNTTLTGVHVAEGAFSGTGTLPALSCDSNGATLAPGGDITCTATYTVTQADMDAGEITNAASVTATAKTGPVSDDAGAVVEIDRTALVTLEKTATPTRVDTVGATVTYKFVVHNGGNTTLTSIGITEDQFSGTGTLSRLTCDKTLDTLAPGEDITCTATYTVTQADIDAGRITNAASVAADSKTGGQETDDSEAVVDITRTSGIQLLKTADPTTVDSHGGVVTYSFSVTNTGTTTLTDVTLDDAMLGLTKEPCAAKVDPGATVDCAKTYTYHPTQADIDNGGFTNTATATGQSPTGAVSDDDSATVTEVRDSHLVLHKSADPMTVHAVGDTVTYSFSAENAGTTTIHNVTITDPLLGLTDAPCADQVDPGQTVACAETYEYTVTQADVDAGKITNAAVAGGGTTTGDVTGDDTVTVKVDRTAGIQLTKSPAPARVAALTDTVTYSFSVTNVGTTTLTDVTVTDPMLGLTDVHCAATVAPGETVACTGTYDHAVTQADLDAGIIRNTATATAVSPLGSVTDDGTAQVRATRTPNLVLTKTPSVTRYDDADESITYTFTLRNEGNVTLTGVTVEEVSFDGSGAMTITCPAIATMAPGDEATCTAAYTTTQADMDQGSIRNVALARATAPTGAVASAPAVAVVDAAPNGPPRLTLTKEVSPITGAMAGDTLTYTITARNPSANTLSGVGITEQPVANGSGVTTRTPALDNCQYGVTTKTHAPGTRNHEATLAPGETWVCTATYVVTDEDAAAGSTLVNHASADGMAPGGIPLEPVTAQADSKIIHPTLTLTKTATPSGGLVAGSSVAYTIVAKNNSADTTLENVLVAESSLVTADAAGAPLPITRTLPAITGCGYADGSGAYLKSGGAAGEFAEPVTNGAAALEPGQAVVCLANYTLTDADGAGYSLTNTARATASVANHTEPLAATASARSTIVHPMLTVVKTVSSLGHAAHPGEILHYVITVTNQSPDDARITNVGVQEVSLTSSNGSAISRLATLGDCYYGAANTVHTGPAVNGSAILDRGETWVCEATYEVTQEDSDDHVGYLVNHAIGSGTPEHLNEAIRDEGESKPSDVSSVTGLTIVKTVDKTVISHPGELVAYSMVVKNIGETSVTDIKVIDDIDDVSVVCTHDHLAPGETMECDLVYTVNQANFDSGDDCIINQATVEGIDSEGGELSADSNEVRTCMIFDPWLEITKSVDKANAQVGDSLFYTIGFTNKGNVSLIYRFTDVMTTSLTWHAEVDRCHDETGAPAPAPKAGDLITLAPGEALECTLKAYLVTLADGLHGQVVNTLSTHAVMRGAQAIPDSTAEAVTQIAKPRSEAKTGGTVMVTTGGGAPVSAIVLMLLGGLGGVAVVMRPRPKPAPAVARRAAGGPDGTRNPPPTVPMSQLLAQTRGDVGTVPMSQLVGRRVGRRAA